MITVLAANPSIDKLFVVDELVHDAVHRPRDLVAVPGGKGLNLARVARRLGADVRVLGIAAGAAGRWLADALAATGVPGEWVWTRGETRSCLSVAHGPGNQLTEFYERGPQVTVGSWDEYAALVARHASPGDWLVACGSLPDGAPVDGYVTLLNRPDCRTALDTSGETLRRALAGKPVLVKVNAAEAGDALGPGRAAGLGVAELAAALKELCGPDAVVVVTGGVGGAVLVDRDGASFVARLPATGPFPVGSGDAFLAGLLVAHEDDQPWPEALRLATAVAVANAEEPGAGEFSTDRVPQLLAAVDVERGDL